MRNLVALSLSLAAAVVVSGVGYTSVPSHALPGQESDTIPVVMSMTPEVVIEGLRSRVGPVDLAVERNLGALLTPAPLIPPPEGMWAGLEAKEDWIGLIVNGNLVGVRFKEGDDTLSIGRLVRFQIDASDPEETLCIAYYSNMGKVDGDPCIRCPNGDRVCGAHPICCGPNDPEC